MKRECLDVEVVEWPRAGGGRFSSSRCRDKRLLAEAKYAELIDDKVQTPKEEGLECHKDGRNPLPSKQECGCRGT